jgi:hypothetical protein
MASINFNAADVDPNPGFEPVPEGKYVASIIESTLKPTKNGAGEYLELVFEVLEGPYKARRLWERLTLKHVNDTTVRIARGNLASICRAVGVMAPKDSSELHHLPLSITVALRKRDDNGETVNVVKAFERREATASMPRSVSGGAPWKR